jgi:hypothetical protein
MRRVWQLSEPVQGYHSVPLMGHHSGFMHVQALHHICMSHEVQHGEAQSLPNPCIRLLLIMLPISSQSIQTHQCLVTPVTAAAASTVLVLRTCVLAEQANGMHDGSL